MCDNFYAYDIEQAGALIPYGISDPSIPIKYAKTMTGHVYSYSVRTAGEFKRHVAKDYQISPRYLHLLEPEEIQEMDEKGEPSRTVNKYDDEPLLPDVVYYLLCDTLPTQTLMKGIIPTEINSQLQIESTTYRIPLEELIRYPSSCFDYLALYPERLEIVEEYIHKLTDRGWKRLFLNSAALPLMEKHEDLLHHHFVLNGHILAMLPEGVPMITRLLQEGIYPDVVGEFWNNLNRNENAFSLLLEHYPEQLNPFHLSINPSAGPYLLEQWEKHGEEFARRLHWPRMSSIQEYRILSRFSDFIDSTAIHYHSDPAVLDWIRAHLAPDAIRWDILSRQEHPAFLAFVEEHLDRLSDDAWKVLCYNPSAVPLLKRHPERIHWMLLCCNPSEEVIPMIEEYLVAHLPAEVATTRRIVDTYMIGYNQWRQLGWLDRYQHDAMNRRLYPEEGPLYEILSTEAVSLMGMSFVRQHIIETHQEKTVMDDSYRTILNRGAISLHPHALPLLQKYPILIYSNAFSLRNDIYIEVTPSMLD